MKINNFQGDLTGTLANTESLFYGCTETLLQTLNWNSGPLAFCYAASCLKALPTCVLLWMFSSQLEHTYACIENRYMSLSQHCWQARKNNKTSNRDKLNRGLVLMFSKLNKMFFWILWSRKYILLIMKINNFRGDLTDISAIKESLQTTQLLTAQRQCFCFQN